MSQILWIQTSTRGEKSASRQVGAKIIEKLQKNDPNATLIERDLQQTEIPHINEFTLTAFYTPEEKRDEAQHRAVGLSDTLVSEVLAADTLVISTPMWNFSVPSVLKAWLDHVVRTGKTFTYTNGRPQGLVQNTRAIIAISSGSAYTETPDLVSPFLKAALAFIGIKDTTIIHAQGVNDPRFSQTALPDAFAQIEKAI